MARWCAGCGHLYKPFTGWCSVPFGEMNKPCTWHYLMPQQDDDWRDWYPQPWASRSA